MATRDTGTLRTYRSHELVLPLERELLSDLTAGDEVLLSGPVFTMRDAGHARTLEMLAREGELPFDLMGHTLFYAGPTPAHGERPVGSVGPTTASRMDFAAPAMYEAGIAATIGKGSRSQEIAVACKAYSCVYFAALGGAAALLARHVVSTETIAFQELGTEALVRMEIERFPAIVAVDTQGRDLFEELGGGRE